MSVQRKRPIVTNFPVNDLLVRLSLGLSVCHAQCIVKNGRSNPDAVWHGRPDRSMDEVGCGV